MCFHDQLLHGRSTPSNCLPIWREVLRSLADNTPYWQDLLLSSPGTVGRPVVIAVVEVAPLPSDPTSATYINGMPDFRHPAAVVQGIVSRPSAYHPENL